MTTNSRQYTFLDQAIIGFNNAFKMITPLGSMNKPSPISDTSSQRSSPANSLPEPQLTDSQRREVSSLMRINHVGEVCAQALYQGQSLTARSDTIKEKLAQAAREEQDHLAWCEQRVRELGGHTSYLNPFWYTTSLMIGALAGFIGDAVSLGFLAETEHQVEKHLAGHLHKIPANDEKTLRILEQMRIDEMQHALTAEEAGATPLPEAIKILMRLMSKVMTTTAYWI